MKKYMDSLLKIDSSKLNDHAMKLRNDISDIKKGIKIGDIQNPKTLMLKKRELSRALTLINKPVRVEDKLAESVSKKTKKESK